MAITDGLISYYKLDETSGTAFSDSHGSNNGTNSGATLNVSGRINTGYDFESADPDYIVTDGNTNLSGSGSRTISGWIKIESMTAQIRPWSHGAFGSQNPFGCLIDTDNHLWFFGWGPNDADTGYNISGDIAKWTHVVQTYNGTNVEMFVSGSSVWSGSRTISSTNTPLRIGMLYGNNAAPFDGVIDEVGIWSRVLTGAEITSLYNSGAGLAYPFTTGTNAQINIGDAWKSISAMQINIGDAWKAVAGAKINVGDVWKTIF